MLEIWSCFQKSKKASSLKGPVARSSLRGGGGELGNSKLRPMAPTSLHKIIYHIWTRNNLDLNQAYATHGTFRFIDKIFA